MPPPTVVDPWLAGRHFGIVIDAGSSGSRLQIYSWKDPRSLQIEKGSALAQSLPIVEKGARKGEAWVTKVEPGLSHIDSYLSQIINRLLYVISQESLRLLMILKELLIICGRSSLMHVPRSRRHCSMKHLCSCWQRPGCGSLNQSSKLRC